MDRKARGQVDTTTGEVTTDEETVTEDTLGGLPRSNYLTTEPTPTYVQVEKEPGVPHAPWVKGPIKQHHGFAASIQAMPQTAIDAIFEKFPFTKRGRE